MPQKHSPAENFYSLFLAVRKKLSETTAGYWSDLEIYSSLNQAQLYVVRKTKILKRTATITTTESIQEYDLRSTTNGFADIIDISEDGVEFNTNGTSRLPLHYKTIAQLNHESPGWRDVADSVPLDYYYDKPTKTVGIHPKPNSSNAGAYLFVSGYHKPKVLIAGTASSGSVTTLVMPAGSSTAPYPNPTNDYYNNLYIEIYSGTGAGQKMKITDYVGSTRTLTFAIATSPDNTSVFGFIPGIPEEQHFLMKLYAIADSLEKGGSRKTLATSYWRQFYSELGIAIGETIEADDEELIKDTYR